MQGLMMDRPLLISSILTHAAAVSGDREVISREADGRIHRITYRDAALRIERLAKALLELGIGPGDRVGSLAWNNRRHFELYYAVAGIGAVLHTINPRLHPEQLAYVADHAEDKALFFDPCFAPLVRAVQNRLPQIRHFISMEAETALPDIRDLTAQDILIKRQSAGFSWPELDENTACALCYTSGTTGLPKGVLYSHRSQILHAYGVGMGSSFGLSPKDKVLPVVPMFHVNAWSIPYAAPMAGADLVLPGPRLDGAGLCELIDESGATFLLGVPTVWLSLLTHCREQGRKLGRVDRVLVGGSALSRALLEDFEREFGVSVIQGWGMTETSPLGTISTLLPKHEALPESERHAVKLKAGRPVFGVELRLIGAEGEELPHDGKSAGLLQIRGPWVAKAYYKRDSDPAFTPDGWFDTGDIGTIDADGYLAITDRAKDVIKSGGEWISSLDLEDAAMTHPDVAQAAVIGLPHPKWQERPLLVVVPRPGRSPEGAEIRRHLESRVAKWWLPDAVEFVDALPIGPTGKVLKTELRKRFEGYRLED
jgi:fatty-acyl-CoA synthase